MLEKILARKRIEIEAARAQAPLSELKERVKMAGDVLSLKEALVGKNGPRHRIIAEVKRASPSKGIMRQDLDAGEWAQMYERAGAAAISVLTDETFFHGSLSDLEAVSSRVRGLPILRKDFLIDPYQIWEARCHGADAVLLIVRALESAIFRRLQEAAWELGMEALVEVSREEDLDAALLGGARIIGINNRDLSTFQVDTNVTKRLVGRIPGDVVVVSASGIHSPEQIPFLESCGVRAFLIGEALVTADRPEEKLMEFVS